MEIDGAIIFSDGIEQNTLELIKSLKNKGIPMKVVRYDNLPLTANIGFKKYFPREAYKNYNNKPLKCLKHLDSWVASFEKRGLKVIHIEYKFDKEGYIN